MKPNSDSVRRYYPRSFLRLLLLSFVAVALPVAQLDVIVGVQ